MADPLLNELLRRAAYGQAVEGLNTGFAPVPITFGPTGGTPQAGARGQMPMPQYMGGQMPMQQYMSGQQGPGGEMLQGMPGSGFGNPQTDILDEQGVPLTVADVIGQIANFGSLVMSPTSFGIQAMTGNLPGTAVKGMLTPVQTLSQEAITLAEQMGISVNDAQGLIDAMGLGGVQAATGMADIAESGAAGAGPSGDVGGIGGIGDVSEGSGGASPW